MNKDYDLVQIENRHGVRMLTLNRPDVLNAMNATMMQALLNEIQAAADDTSVRCLVITGTGKAFCSGQDLGEYRERAESGHPIDLEKRLQDVYHPVIAALQRIEKPVIASVNGSAAGAGFSLALGCDFRIAAESAKFIQAFIRIGLVPDCASTYLLPRLIGTARAADLMMTGRVVSAQEAESLGFVNRVVADDVLMVETWRAAEELAKLPTKAVGLIKRAINESWSVDLETQLELEARLQTIASNTDDHQEGIQAFFEKREPEYQGK